jgi:hypothetical protein
MVRLAILDQNDRVLSPKDVATAAELTALINQARNLIRDCDRLMHETAKKQQSGGEKQVPYSS